MFWCRLTFRESKHQGVITDTSAATWPGASEHIPFIFDVKAERIRENGVFLIRAEVPAQ